MDLSALKVLMTLWLNRWWLVMGGLVGIVLGGYHVMSSYRYVAVQRISIESKSSSYIQGLTNAMPGPSWGGSMPFQEAQNSIRKLNQRQFFEEVAGVLFSDAEFVSELKVDRSWVVVRRIGLGRILPKSPAKEISLPDVVWTVRGVIAFRVDEADGIEIRATHQSPIVAAKIANQAAKTGKEFIAKTSLDEIDQAAAYIETRIAETMRSIEAEDTRAAQLTSSSGKSPDFDRLSSAEQQHLSRELLNAEMEIQSNEIIIRVLHGKSVGGDSPEHFSTSKNPTSAAIMIRVDELLASYGRMELLEANNAASETYELRTLRATIRRLESELQTMGFGADAIAKAATLVSGGLSASDLEKRNQLLKTQSSVARKLLDERIMESQQAFNINLAREAIARSRGVLFRNLEYLNAQRFELDLKKIAIANKFGTNADESPAGALRIPSVRNVLIFSMLGSIFICAALVIFMSMGDPIVMTLSDIPGYQSSSRLGQIHMMSRKMIRSKSLSPRVLNDFKHVAQRLLKMSRSATGKTLKTIAVSSSRSGEGKSFVTFHVSVSLARAGKRVLYIDGDLLASRFAWQNYAANPVIYSSKFFDVLSGAHSMDLCRLRDLTYAEFSKVLHSESWSALAASYDYVMIDLPPISLVPETVDIVRMADVGAFVVAAARHKTTVVAESYDMFAEHTKDNPLLILNFSREFDLGSTMGHYGAYGDYLTRSASRASASPTDESIRRPAA